VALEAACRLRLLEDDGAQSYRFMHDVIREVIEADLGTARRLLLHRRVAEALAAQPSNIPLEALAYHYSRGEEWDNALRYLERAGNRTMAAHALRDAADHYGQALAACEHLDVTALPTAFVLVDKRKFVLCLLGDYSAVEQDIAWLLARTRRLGDRR